MGVLKKGAAWDGISHFAPSIVEGRSIIVGVI